MIQFLVDFLWVLTTHLVEWVGYSPPQKEKKKVSGVSVVWFYEQTNNHTCELLLRTN